MAHLADVIGWKFNHEQGMSTVAGKLTAWPLSLGTWPTDAQLATWTGEYDDFIATTPTPTRKEELLAIGKDNWTDAQQKELIELLASP